MDTIIQKNLEQFNQVISKDKENLHEVLCKNSSHKEVVSLLQKLLNDIGCNLQADGVYGNETRNAINAFIKNITSEGFCLPGTIAVAISEAVKSQMTLFKKSPKSTAKGNGLTIKELDSGGKPKLTISSGDITAKFRKFKKGVYTFGKQKPGTIINDKKDEFKSIGLTDSEVNIIMAVSENEGNLDAVNTWDNSFLSFGMFQWTTGAGKQPGELAALLKRIKDKDESLFEKYYGRYGLDIAPKTNKLTGFMTLDGKEMIRPIDKSMLRKPKWAFFFWQSGQDFLIHLVQVQHAFARIKLFYHRNAYKIKNHYISDLITSEYGIALVLDNHINRPGYIKACLEQALDSAMLPEEPSSWKTEDELKLLDAYLKIRATYGLHPMTHADKRAERVQKYRDDGTLSDMRGTFETTIADNRKSNNVL